MASQVVDAQAVADLVAMEVKKQLGEPPAKRVKTEAARSAAKCAEKLKSHAQATDPCRTPRLGVIEKLSKLWADGELTIEEACQAYTDSCHFEYMPLLWRRKTSNNFVTSSDDDEIVSSFLWRAAEPDREEFIDDDESGEAVSFFATQRNSAGAKLNKALPTCIDNKIIRAFLRNMAVAVTSKQYSSQLSLVISAKRNNTSIKHNVISSDNWPAFLPFVIDSINQTAAVFGRGLGVVGEDIKSAFWDMTPEIARDILEQIAIFETPDEV